MSGYLHALWTEGLQEHRYNKVNTRSMKSSSPLESLTRSVYHTDQTRQTCHFYIHNQIIPHYRQEDKYVFLIEELNEIMVKCVRYRLCNRMTLPDHQKSVTYICVSVRACTYVYVYASSSSHYLGSLQVRAQQAI